jgi:hypothetical protein
MFSVISPDNNMLLLLLIFNPISISDDCDSILKLSKLFLELLFLELLFMGENSSISFGEFCTTRLDKSFWETKLSSVESLQYSAIFWEDSTSKIGGVEEIMDDEIWDEWTLVMDEIFELKNGIDEMGEWKDEGKEEEEEE